MSTEQLYISQIRTVLPNIKLEWVERASGQFNDILIINQEWVFRFPRYRDGVARLAAEAQLLDALDERLPLAIPRPAHRSFTPPVPGLAFIGYPRLPGESFTRQWLGEVRDDFVRDDLARKLAAFLRALHSLPLTEFPTQLPGTPTSGRIAEQRCQWETMYADVRQKLFPAMRPDARQQVTAHYERFLDEPSLHEFSPCLRHGDFGGSNILWQPSGGAITAVIDFSSCAVGDPAYDLASIWTLGEDFFERLVPRYELEADRRFILVERARFYRGTFALEEALDGLRYNDAQAYQAGMKAYV